MNRKAETFFDAITLLREDLVEEAQNYVFRRKRGVWRKFGSLAACVALVASLGLLAALPRGCGASSGNSAAPMEPAESTGDANTNNASGDTSGWDGAQAEPNPAPSIEAPPAAEEPLRFTAQVLEVLEDGLLVEPFDSAPEDLDAILIPTAELENLPQIRPGDVVTILCGGIAWEDGEAVALDVTEMWLTEPESP